MLFLSDHDSVIIIIIININNDFVLSIFRRSIAQCLIVQAVYTVSIILLLIIVPSLMVVEGWDLSLPKIRQQWCLLLQGLNASSLFQKRRTKIQVAPRGGLVA
jgi:hypothetical protein